MTTTASAGRAPVSAWHHAGYGAVVLASLAAQAVFLVFSLLGVMLTDSCTPESAEAVCGPGILAIVAVPFVFALVSLIAIVVGWIALSYRRRAWAWGLLLGSTASFFAYWFGAVGLLVGF